MLVDIHAKSSHSNGVSTSIDGILQRAASAGLDGVLVAETLSTAHYEQALAAGEKHGVKVFIGVEIPTDKGILIGVVPDLDRFYKAEEWRRLTELTVPEAALVISMFQDKGGVILAARPYDLEVANGMGDLIFTLDGLSGVQAFNPRTSDLQNDFAIEAASYLGLPSFGGSDPKGGSTHTGTYATLFLGDIEDQAAFVAAIASGDFWAVRYQDPSKVDRREDRGGRSSGGGERRGGSGGRRDDRGGRGGDRRGGRRDDRGGDRRGGDRRGGGGGGRGGDRRRRRD